MYRQGPCAVDRTTIRLPLGRRFWRPQCIRRRVESESGCCRRRQSQCERESSGRLEGIVDHDGITCRITIAAWSRSRSGSTPQRILCEGRLQCARLIVNGIGRVDCFDVMVWSHIAVRVRWYRTSSTRAAGAGVTRTHSSKILRWAWRWCQRQDNIVGRLCLLSL